MHVRDQSVAWKKKRAQISSSEYLSCVSVNSHWLWLCSIGHVDEAASISSPVSLAIFWTMAVARALSPYPCSERLERMLCQCFHRDVATRDFFSPESVVKVVDDPLVAGARDGVVVLRDGHLPLELAQDLHLGTAGRTWKFRERLEKGQRWASTYSLFHTRQSHGPLRRGEQRATASHVELVGRTRGVIPGPIGILLWQREACKKVRTYYFYISDLVTYCCDKERSRPSLWAR